MADDSKRSLPKGRIARSSKVGPAAGSSAGASPLLKGPPAEGTFANKATPLQDVAEHASLRDILGGVREGTVRPERAQFRALLLSNPNYFGTLEGSEFAPVLPIQGNTTYEELQCVGFDPQLELLEAVVLVKQDSGFLGGICTSGSIEYIRFYLSFDGGATWDDQGQASFSAHDIPGDKPLEYAVSLAVDPKKRWCFVENLIKVRAILSWNNPPPANSPNFSPVWGNAVDADIQVDPFWWFYLGDLLTEAKVKIPADLVDLVDLQTPIPGPPPKKLDALELHSLYAKADVPPHRYLLDAVEQQLTTPGLAGQITVATEAAPLTAAGLSANVGAGSIFQTIGIDVGDLIKGILDTFGNTTYEELDCVGLNRVTDSLEAVLSVKLSSGYSGELCTAGSYEYVAFWTDWGSGWEYAGTSSVNVHDIKNLPPNGLSYGVVLPISLAERRRPCKSGAQVIRVRATLSWQTPPSKLDPDYEPTWGNRIDTLVEIAPGPEIPVGTHPPSLETIGHVDVVYINPATGLATGPSTGGFSVLDSPFGAAILLTGHLAYPPNSYGGGAQPLRYRVWVSSDAGASWQTLSYPFGIAYRTLTSGVWSAGIPFTQTEVELGGWYEYLEDITGSAQRFVTENVLHIWHTNPTMNDLAYILIEAKDPADPFAPHWWSNLVTIRLDNLIPEVSLAITSGGGGCADFDVGDLIQGAYEVSDQGDHFGSFHLYVMPSPQADLGELTVDPAGPSVVGPVAPPNISRSYTGLPGGVPTTGESGAWSLDTAKMKRCGYVLRLDAWDRTNVNSTGPGWSAVPATVGLCLRDPDKKK